MSREELPFGLESDERVLWSKRPETAPYLGKSLIFTILGLFFAIPATAVLIEIKSAPLFLLALPGIIAIVGYFLAIIPPLAKVLSLKKVKYLITNKRIVILGGVFDSSIKTIDFSDIESVIIRRGFWDKRFGTSTLYIIVKGVFIVPSFSSITNAEEAKELIERMLAERR